MYTYQASKIQYCGRPPNNVFLQLIINADMSNPSEYSRPIIGITCGDLNGIGLELVIKTVSNTRLLELCTPIVFASNKAINFYRKSVTESNFNFQNIKDFTRINSKQVNIFNCWEDEVPINPGQLSDAAGKFAVLSLTTAVQALKDWSLLPFIRRTPREKRFHLLVIRLT